MVGAGQVFKVAFDKEGFLSIFLNAVSSRYGQLPRPGIFRGCYPVFASVPFVVISILGTGMNLFYRRAGRKRFPAPIPR